jgi:hypothetical protein
VNGSTTTRALLIRLEKLRPGLATLEKGLRHEVCLFEHDKRGIYDKHTDLRYDKRDHHLPG